MTDYIPIAESTGFIVLEKYTKLQQLDGGYQSEADLERELIRDLTRQGYEYLTIHKPDELLVNVRVQLEKLNKVQFTNEEWGRFCAEYLNKVSDNHIDKTRKIHIAYLYDFVFDDGRIQNIALVDKKI